jgi:hypothetical protein
MSAQLISISAGENGSVWGIGADGTLLAGQKQQPPSWLPVVCDMNFKQVAAGNPGRIWCLDAQGRVFRSENPAAKPFAEAPGAEFTSIAAGADGKICGVDLKGQALRFDEATQAWSPMPSSPALAKVTVGKADDICAVDGQGRVYQLVADKWEQIGQGFSDVDVGPDGALWALDAGGKLFCQLGSEWRDTGRTFRSISAGDPRRLWGIDSNGDAIDWRLYPGCCCGPRLGSHRLKPKFAADEPVDAAGHVRPMFAANDPFDEAKSTHLFIVKMAARLAAKQGPIGKKFYDIFQPDQVRGDVFHDAVCQGVYDADYLAPYNDSDTEVVWKWKSHFYDPDTGKNYRGETDPTALTRGRKLFQESVAVYHKGDKRGAGYALGLSLHYLTDLGQPMHAANYTNADLPVGWHSKFEEEIVLHHQSDFTFDDPYSPSNFGVFPDNYFIELAKLAKKNFQDYNLKIENTQNAIRVTAPILRQAITIASQYMVAWMRLADPAFQQDWHWWDLGGIIDAPVGVTTIGGKPNIFVRDINGVLWRNSLDGASGQWFNHGTPTGATVASPVGAVASFPFAHVFVRGSNGHLWANWSSDGGLGWQWSDLGGNFAGPIGAAIVAGQPSAFVWNSEGVVWRHSGFGATGQWFYHDSPSHRDVIVASPVGVVATGQTGHAFVLGSDGNLWVNYSADGGAHWGWSNQGKPSGKIAGSVGATIFQGRQYAFVLTTDGHVWANWWDGGAWHWSDFGSPLGGTAVAPVGVVDSGAQAHVFVKGSDDSLWVKPMGGTSQTLWRNLGARPPGFVEGVGAAPMAYGTGPFAFVRGADSRLWMNAFGVG